MALNSKIRPVELIGEKVFLIDQTILPSHIYYSPNMNQKYVKEYADGTKEGPHKTDNFDRVDWGF